MRVTVFGGADPKPGDQAYEQARLLGRLLAEAGHTVVTGGYIGTMEAASCGAAEAGGHVVGVTCRQIEAWRGVKANPWVKEEWACDTLMDRLWRLMDRSDTALALPGGAGTLAEIALLWNLLLIDALPRRPLITIGDEWRCVFGTLYGRLGSYVPPRARALVSHADDVRDAVRQIERECPR